MTTWSARKNWPVAWALHTVAAALAHDEKDSPNRDVEEWLEDRTEE